MGQPPLGGNLPDLGLPDGYNPAYIPTPSDLQAVAIRELDDWTAFVVTHQDDPEEIASRVEEIASFVRAALEVKGDHQAKTIRLGLSLEYQYWASCQKVHDWVHLIMSMLGASLEIGRVDLQSEVYQALGSYLFITQRQPNAIKALEVALDYAGHWGREDLALLARAEHFNIESTAIELAEAELGARHLIAEARHMRYTYVEGRVYVSLMRAYQARMLPDQIFEAAQQALVIFIHLEIWGLAIQALNGMIGSLQVYEGRSTCYREILLAWLDRLTQRSVHPWFRVTSDQLYAAECYRMGDYHQARKYALRAWVGHRAVTGMARETGRIMHFMGLIQTKRRRWHLAERYLIRAGRFYREAGEKVPLIHTYHALAFIPYEQGDFERALPLLEDTLHRAQELPDQLVREALCQVIGDDLDNTRRQMERCRRETASQ